MTQRFLSSVTPCSGASVFIFQRYDSRQRAATQTGSSKRSHTCSLRPLMLAKQAGREEPRRATRASPSARGRAISAGAATPPFPGPPPASAKRLSPGSPREPRIGRRGCGGGRARPALGGTRSGTELPAWDGQSPAEPRRHLPGGLPAEAAPVQQPHLAEEDAVDEGHGGKLVQLQLHAELELLLLRHDEGHGPGASRGPPPRQLRSAPATPLRSTPIAGPGRSCGRSQLSPCRPQRSGPALTWQRAPPFETRPPPLRPLPPAPAGDTAQRCRRRLHRGRPLARRSWRRLGQSCSISGARSAAPHGPQRVPSSDVAAARPCSSPASRGPRWSGNLLGCSQPVIERTVTEQSIDISTLHLGSSYCNLNPTGVVYGRSTCDLQPAPLLLQATDARGLVEKEGVQISVYI